MSTSFDYTRIPPLPPSVYVAPLKKPAGVGDDWLEPAQRKYSAEEHRIWDDLYERQMKLMPGHACREFMHGLDRLDLHRAGVPDFNEISEELRGLTGWTVVPVPRLIPDHVFYYHLANRRFPACNFDGSTDRATGAHAFVHPSEAEFAGVLDFYRIRWHYEPKSFPLAWDEAGRVAEAFTPDFYLPDLDLYLELTTLKQSLVTDKNRKIRKFRELYPDIQLKVFYGRDLRSLVQKYGLSRTPPGSGPKNSRTEERHPS